MKRLLEIVVFGGLAAGAHLWLLGAGAMRPGGAEGAGDDGAALLTLVASNAGIERMVAAWERPPVTADAPEMTAPLAPPSAPEIATSPPAQVTSPPKVAGLALPRSEPPVRVDTTPPAAPAPEIGTEPAAALAPPQPPEPDAGVRPDRDAPPAVRPMPRPAAPPEPDRQAQPETAPAPQTAPASTAQKAAGRGGGAAAGAADADADAASRERANGLLARWGAQIRARVERNKRPPRGAHGKSGRVVLRVVVGRDGTLRGVSVTRSSGIAALDRAAAGAVERTRRFPPAPKGLTQADYTFELPVRF